MARNRVLRTGLYTMATTALAATAFAGMASTASADTSAEAGEQFGCPAGSVCLYSEQGWESQSPEHEYEAYGVHPLKAEYGPHVIYNNQTGGAMAAHCDTSDGRECGKPFKPGVSVSFADITPINSIRLMP